MIFRHFMLEVPGLEPNAFVVGCEATHAALLVDIGVFDPRIEAFLSETGLDLKAVFITHDHYDHSGGLAEILECYDAEAYSQSGYAGGCPANKVGHGDTIRIGNLTGKVVATPGHTPDGLSLIFPGHIFTGDALFSGSVGGTSSPALAEQQLKHIREHLFPLPGDYEIHVGHGPSSTIGVERQFNPFFV